MPVFRRLLLAAAVLALSLAAKAQPAASPAQSHLLVLISIDGLRPEAVLNAQAHGLALPNLTKMMVDGAYSTGVTGVLPALTYPSHTTILTGVSPAKHGIFSNTPFDPYNENEEGWYWYSEDIKVPTLWDAIHNVATTANVDWPVSAGATGINYNLPQIWRAGTDDDLKLQRTVATPGLIRQLEVQAGVYGASGAAPMSPPPPGHYPGGKEQTVAEDVLRAQYAIRLLALRRPNFMTVYFSGLNFQQRLTGPFSPEANAALERIDGLVGQIRTAAEKQMPGRTFTCVVSGHGSAAVQKDVNLYSELFSNGFLPIDQNNLITDSWTATAWYMGGSAAIVLHHPDDAATRTKVDALLTQLAANPANGIARILTQNEVVAAGGSPSIESMVVMAPGYELGAPYAPPPLVTPSGVRGMEGFLPDQPDMKSSFFLTGPGVHAGKSFVGTDLRSIAPTLASLMGVKLPNAEMPPLNLQ